MKFPITITVDRKTYTYQVERVHENLTIEHFKVIAKNKTIILKTNRKLFISKGLKHRSGTWSVIEGSISNSGALDAITKAIDLELEKQLL